MTPNRPIIDAGPALNVFSVNRERLLLGTPGRLRPLTSSAAAAPAPPPPARRR